MIFGPRIFSAIVAGASVTVTAVAPAIGDTLGGDSVVITGTGFTGATASDVLFGATAAASIVVDSDLQITAVSPAHSAATVDVTVLGVTLAACFEFWSPAELGSVTGFWMQGNYANSGSAGTWTSRAGANFTNSAAIPPAVSSEPVFGGAAGQGLSAGAANLILPQNPYTAILGFRASSSGNAYNATIYDSTAILSTGGGNWGCHFDTTRGFTSYYWNGAPVEQSVALSTNNWTIATARVRRDVSLQAYHEARVDRGSFTSTATGFGSSTINGGDLVAGTTYTGGGLYSGELRFVVIANIALTDADCNKIYDWALARWPVFA